MSLAATLRPVGLSFGSSLQSNASGVAHNDVPFHNEPNYLQLHRMLIRYQNLILLIPSPNSQDVQSDYELSPLQRRVRAELYSSLPYHRTKWLHTIESARNLLLTLERQTQDIKSPRAKKDALRDLAEKRQVIKRLKNRVEDIGREVETSSMSDRMTDSKDEELLGERVDIILAKMGRGMSITRTDKRPNQVLEEGKPVTSIDDRNQIDEPVERDSRDALLGSSIRRRQGQTKDLQDKISLDQGNTSGFSNLRQTEQSLHNHTREHEDLTSALVSMAAQLKQQSRAFQFSLKQDESFLNKAVEGLDLNLTSMEAASKNMAFLRRMSEEQGWLGRLKLYAIILGLWVAAVLLVFVGPKLRF